MLDVAIMDSEETTIWNRACMKSGGTSPREGDAALASLLSLHSLAMNGGLVHSLEVLGPARCAAAVEGFRYFGLAEMAALIERALEKPDAVIPHAGICEG